MKKCHFRIYVRHACLQEGPFTSCLGKSRFRCSLIFLVFLALAISKKYDVICVSEIYKRINVILQSVWEVMFAKRRPNARGKPGEEEQLATSPGVLEPYHAGGMLPLLNKRFHQSTGKYRKIKKTKSKVGSLLGSWRLFWEPSWLSWAALERPENANHFTSNNYQPLKLLGKNLGTDPILPQTWGTRALE